MSLKTFIKQARQTSFWNKKKTYCFSSGQYPLTFFAYLFDHVKKKELLSAPYQRIFIDTTDKKEIYSNLSQSILGSYSFFWLGNIGTEKKSKQNQKLLDFLINYQGPHSISFFVTHDSKLIDIKKLDSIDIPDHISYQELIDLIAFFELSFDVHKKNFLKKLFQTSKTIHLEAACNIIKHLELVGNRSLDSMESYFAHVIDTSPTLTQLSQHFFARQPKFFFSAWQNIRHEYSDMFWITFWSGQLWKAHNATGYLKQKNFVAAKRMSYRLPFTFINKDWKLCNQRELAQAYEFLYAMDYAIKTGSTTDVFDLFFMNYFQGKFR